jgi:FXSXX-COOH protein
LIVNAVRGEVGVVDRTGEDDPTDWRSPMVDVSGMSPEELAAAREGDSALAHCLRRLAEETSDPGEPIAGFNSAL